MCIFMDNLLKEGDEAFDNDDFPKAIELYKQAFELDPEDRAPSHSLNSAYFAAEEYDLALDTAKLGLDLFPDESRFAFNAGLSSNRLEENYDAINFYSRSIGRNPRYALAYYAQGNCFFEWKEYGRAESDFRTSVENGGKFDELGSRTGHPGKPYGGSPETPCQNRQKPAGSSTSGLDDKKSPDLEIEKRHGGPAFPL